LQHTAILCISDRRRTCACTRYMSG
jgi:hypothetical protein